MKMDSKSRHPFMITCRKCGSNDIVVYACEYQDLYIKCNCCGNNVSCGTYYTMKYDYSNC